MGLCQRCIGRNAWNSATHVVADTWRAPIPFPQQSCANEVVGNLRHERSELGAALNDGYSPRAFAFALRRELVYLRRGPVAQMDRAAVS